MMARGLPQKRNLPHVKKVICVSSSKGGVGKSTCSANLAIALAKVQPKRRVGLLDLDIFGPSVPTIMGLEEAGEPFLTKDGHIMPHRSHGVDCMSMGFLIKNARTRDAPIVWRGMMVAKAVQQLLFDVDWRSSESGNALDLLVIDLPPGTGDVQLSLGQLVILNGAIIVSTPQEVALKDTRAGIQMFKQLNVPIFGSILNMTHFICANCKEPHWLFGSSDGFNSAAERYGIQILARLPLVADINEGNDLGSPLMARHDDQTTGQKDATDELPAQAFLTMANRIWKQFCQWPTYEQLR